MLQKKQVVRRPTSNSSGLQIQQSEGKVSIYKTAWCVIGPPGVGKSTLFSGFDGALYLVTSEKELTRLNVPYILIDSWEKMLTTVDELVNNREKYSQYKFLVIDFIDALWTLCVIATCLKLGVQHTSDAAYGKGTDTVDTYFKKLMTQLIASDYSIMCISHVNQKEVFGAGGTVTKTICTLPPRARNIIFPLINVIGCIEHSRVKVNNPATGKIELQNKRVMKFEATDYIEAKDRDGVMPAELVLFKDSKKNFEMFKDYYEGKRKR